MQNDPEIQQILRLLSDVENLTNTEQEYLLKLGTKKYVSPQDKEHLAKIFSTSLRP